MQVSFSKKKSSPIKIILVVSNNSKAKGLIFAKNNHINYIIANFSNVNKAESKILKKLKKDKIDLICLAGFMKILSKKFIKKFSGKIVNIHPSLLPKYKELNTHQKALKNNSTLKSEALKSDLISESDYNKLVDPKKMIGPS